MSTDSTNDFQIPPNLLGIKVVYCQGNTMKEMWVDLTAVAAISWGDQPMDPKTGGNGNPHGPRLPKGKKPKPDACDENAGAPGGGTGMCWWDGKDWVCGEAEE